MAKKKSADTFDWGKELALKEKYVYNAKTQHYVIPTKHLKEDFAVLHASKVRMLRRDYTENNLSVSTLSVKYKIPKLLLEDVLNKLDITHTSLPVTNEDLLQKKDDALISDLLQQRKFDFSQSLEKESWERVQKDAVKWQKFVAQVYDPFTFFLESWKPPVYKPVAAPKVNKSNRTNRVFVVGAFDWHIGGIAEARYLLNGKDWNIKQAQQSVLSYLKQIQTTVANDITGFSSCVFLLGGDLYNSLTGYTANGTQLKNEVSGDTQFEAIMNLLVFFVEGLLALFPKVDAHFVRGNHGGVTDIPLGHAIKNYFRTDKRLNFTVYSARTAPVRVNDTLLLLDHGASDACKAKVPKGDKAKEAYVQNLMLATPEKLRAGVNHTIFVMGDLHHYQQIEFSNFEFFQFGALPCGDQFAEALNLRSRPRQNCLIIGEQGVEAVQHYYL